MLNVKYTCYSLLTEIRSFKPYMVWCGYYGSLAKVFSFTMSMQKDVDNYCNISVIVYFVSYVKYLLNKYMIYSDLAIVCRV